MVKGNTLNHLGSNKFDVHGPRSSTSKAIPKAVKRVHEIFEKPTFMKDTLGSDIKQGSLGDCWIVAAFSALANVEDGIKRCCVEYDTRIGIYGFVFWRDGEWVYSIVDDKLFLTSPNWDSPSMQRDLMNQLDREQPEKEYRKTYQTGSKALFFGQARDQNETWPALMEKAFAKAHGDYGSLAGGWIGEGVEDLSGGVTTELLVSDILDLDGFWEDEISKVNQEFVFGLSTGLLDGGYGERDGIREGHAYVMMDAKTLKNGQRLVKLRNPWGKTRKGIWNGPWSDGSKEWNSEAASELNHEFGNDSVFWITYEDMLEKFQHVDRTRLFKDKDWRMCQRWIGVEAPWKPQWNEKFHVTLTKESPLVIVLQQLDGRYFKGLHGQYTYRLHFRIHEQGRPDAEDYIVRSHGNYLMERSVAVEIPCMEPGKYSVFIKVVADRDTDLTSVENVVKRECRKRIENDKLAQVGYAYDLAHSKGVAHLEQIEKLRKASDSKKASVARQKERRKLWERREINRECNRKQKVKNKEKSAKRRAAHIAKWEKEQDELEAARKKDAAEKAASEKAAAQKKAEDAVAAKEKVEAAAAAAAAAATTQPVSSEATEASTQTQTTDEITKPAEAQTVESTSVASSESSGTPQDTPASENSEPATDESKPAEEKVEVPPISGGPPPEPEQKQEQETASAPIEEQPAARPAPPPYNSDNDSSDSPIEDWELMYSSDDMAKKPRLAAPPPAANNDKQAPETDGESSMPDPWNAVCIVGFRVYSKDEDLQVRVVIEGGELAENGMGEKGSADIDNAQMNAAGGREKPAAEDAVTDEVEIIDGTAVSMPKIVVDQVRAVDDRESDEGSEADVEDEDDVVVKQTRRKRRASSKKGKNAADDKKDDVANDSSSSTDSVAIATPGSFVTDRGD